MNNNEPKATDEQIYRYLCGDIEVGEMYLSPLPANWRKSDTGESFGLYLKPDGVVRWHDFGLADQDGNKAINLLMYMRNCDYRTACRIRDTEVAMEWKRRPFVELKKGRRALGEDILPYVEYDDKFADYELRYWDRYKEIGREDLVHQQIYSLKSLRWGNSKNQITSTPGDPAFIYIFNRNPISWKIYRPLNQSNQKFRQWGIENVVEGLHQIHPAEIGIFVSSTKERLVCCKACPEMLFLNPTGESSYIQIINRWPEIRPYARQWHIMYDADNAGYLAGETLSSHINIPNVDTRHMEQKDFSDFIDKYKGDHSYNDLRTLIHNLIN